jgi:hypothetical protein
MAKAFDEPRENFYASIGLAAAAEVVKKRGPVGPDLNE